MNDLLPAQTSNNGDTTEARKPRKRIKRITSEVYLEFQQKCSGSTQDPTRQHHSTGHETYTYGELQNMNFKQSPWLLQGLMRTNEVAMVYAGTGVGKTWLTLSLAMVAAGGGKLLDWTNDTPRRVLYIDGEMDAAELVGRMAQLSAGLECNADALSKNFVLCARQMQKTITGSFIEIETEESQLGILKYAQEQKFDLIVIDNLTTLSGQLDENASKDMKLFNTFLLRAKQLGIAVLVVHHQGKGKDSGPRGSTAMVATLNLILKLEASSHERAVGDKDARFTVVFEKNRGNVESRPLAVKVTASAFDDKFKRADTASSNNHDAVVLMIDPDADSNVIRAVKLLKTCKYKTQSELAAACGVKQPAMSKILKSAVAQAILRPNDTADYYRRAREAAAPDVDVVVEEDTEDF